MSFDVESDNCRSKGAHQIFDLTIRCVRKYIDAAAVLCKLLAAQVDLCKSLKERLSGCLADDQKPKEPNCYLANFCKFSDQHKRASSESELEYWTAMSPYPLASQQSACRKVLQLAIGFHSFNVSKEVLQSELELKASKYSFNVSGNPSASWFFSSLRCPSDFPNRLCLLSLHVPPSNSNFLSQPPVALAGTQTAPS